MTIPKPLCQYPIKLLSSFAQMSAVVAQYKHRA